MSIASYRALRSGSRRMVWLLGMLLALWLAEGTAVAATFATATNGNTSTATAQPINPFATLVLEQGANNTSRAKAQAVSPAYYGSEVDGALAAGHPGEFYSFTANSGANINLYVTAQTPQSQFTELLLYNPSGNLVAVAAGNAPDGSSSQILFTANSTGLWMVEVVASHANNYFNYSLRLQSPITYLTDIMGTLASGSQAFYYAVAANAGDNLALAVSARNPATEFPELELFDNNGNLVAIAVGNGSDGSTSVIGYTVPGGGTGSWIVEVTGDPFHNPALNKFPYDLRIAGATHTGPIDPRK